MAMHEDQLDIDPATAARLIGDLCPTLRGAEIRPLRTAGTTSHIMRIGTELVARFPMHRAETRSARAALEAEHRAVEEFARCSPVPCPRPVVIAPPSEAFPMPWSVQTWVPGRVATPAGVAGASTMAHDLGDLIAALRSADTRGRSFEDTGRGGHLPDHDDWIRLCLERSRGLLPVAALTERWSLWRDLERAQPDVMTHGDLIPANLLTDGARLVGVLDTGGFSPADPALDLVGAWHLLDGPRRAALRDRLGCTALEWERGRAWAFAQAVGLVWYYRESNPAMAELGRTTIGRLLEQ